MAISNELKRAIVEMPLKEKDKLLLKLIGKDDLLIEKLQFELIEQGDTIELRREEIRQRINRVASMHHDTAGWMMMDMRTISGEINQHLKVTKDKYGDVELNLYMLNTFFQKQPTLLKIHNTRTDSCALYIAKKTAMILKNLEKLDEDYHIEFEVAINRLLEYVYANCPKNYAKEMNIPTVWKR